MSKKIWNPVAAQTVTQVNSTLNMLYDKALAISFNEMAPADFSQHSCRLSWGNHVPNRANAGKSFTKLEQYLYILKNNSYHCLLFDGSIIRANFEFEDDVLLKQNLLWWPAPYDYIDLLQDGYPPVELLLDFYSDTKWYESIKMRSPIRIDFDSSVSEAFHPQSHMHIQHEETRINMDNLVCFNRFVDFLFRNFYPQLYLDFSPFDYIEYSTPEKLEQSYTYSTIMI